MNNAVQLALDPEWEMKWRVMARELTVYVNAIPGNDAYGRTDIQIWGDDEDRAEFLMNCREFFLEYDREDDANKFQQAAKQNILPTDIENG